METSESVFFRYARRDPNRIEIGDGHHRGGGIVPIFARRDAEIDHAAVHRRRDRDDLGFGGSVGIDADLFQSRHGALILGLGGDVICLRLLQLLRRGSANFRQFGLAGAGLERERQQGLGAVVIRIGGTEVWRIDHDQRLPRLHPLSELHLELGDPAGDRRVDLDEMGRVGLHRGGKNEIALNFLCGHRTDRERGRSGDPSGNDTRLPERMSGRAVLTTTGDGSEYPGESASNR